MCCFPQTQRQPDCFLISSLIYKISSKCNVCYISRATQRLDIWIIQLIFSNILTKRYGYTAAQNNQHSSSAIARHLLENKNCTSAYKPTIFTLLANSNYEFQLSIVKPLIITKHKSEFCIQKQFYAPLFLTTQLDHVKKILVAPTLLACRNFFKSVFFGISSFF